MSFSGFASWFGSVFSWFDQLQRTKKSVTRLEAEMERISKVVERLVFQVEHLQETEQLKRDNMAQEIRHENEMLKVQVAVLLERLENRLPPKS